MTTTRALGPHNEPPEPDVYADIHAAFRAVMAAEPKPEYYRVLPSLVSRHRDQEGSAMTSQPTAYVAHHQGETLEDTYRRADCGDEYGCQVPRELVDDLETTQAAADAAVEAVRRYIAEHNVEETELDTTAPEPEDEQTADPGHPKRHLYLVHDKLTPNNVRAVLDVDELPRVGDILDLPDAGFNGAPTRWTVSLVEPIAGHDSATVYCTDAR